MSSPATRRRSIGAVQLFSLAFGAILGAGWIIALGQWVGQAGPLGTAIGFFAGAGVLSLIALCYAEVGTRYPAAGGEVVYAERLFGDTVSYYTGWFLVITYTAVCAFEAISLGWVLEALIPGFEGPVMYSVLGANIRLSGLCVGLLAVIATAIVNHRGIRTTTRIQDALTALLIVAAITFIAAGFLGGRLVNVTPAFVLDGSGSAWPGMLAIFVTAPFWFSGFGVVSQALGEDISVRQRRQLAFVLLAAILASCLFYVLVVLAASVAVPRDQLLAMPLPAAGAFVQALRSELLGKLVLTAGFLGLLLALNSIFYSATRVLYSLARSGHMPARFARVHSRFGSPTSAVLFVAGLSLLGTVLGRGAIVPLVDSTAITLSCIYIMVCWGTLRARRAGQGGASAGELPGTVWLPAIATLATVLMALVAIVTSWGNSRHAVPVEIQLLLGAALLGMAFRMHRRRRAIPALESVRE